MAEPLRNLMELELLFVLPKLVSPWPPQTVLCLHHSPGDK